MNEARLQAIIDAVNESSRAANFYQPILLNHLSNFVGKKVVLKGKMSLVKSLQEILPKLPNGENGLRVYLRILPKDLAWVAESKKSFINREGKVDWLKREATIPVGILKENKLMSTVEVVYYRDDYTLPSVKSLVQEAQLLKQRYQEIEKSLSRFCIFI